jgi:hypothetical protein
MIIGSKLRKLQADKESAPDFLVLPRTLCLPVCKTVRVLSSLDPNPLFTSLQDSRGSLVLEEPSRVVRRPSVSSIQKKLSNIDVHSNRSTAIQTSNSDLQSSPSMPTQHQDGEGNQGKQAREGQTVLCGQGWQTVQRHCGNGWQCKLSS